MTGGAGFIGSHVVDALLAHGHEVAILDSLDPRVHAETPDYIDRRAELIVGDVCDAEVVSRAMRGADAVSHQASLVGLGRGLADAPRYAMANDVGTATVLRAACEAKVKRFILASSMVVTAARNAARDARVRDESTTSPGDASIHAVRIAAARSSHSRSTRTRDSIHGASTRQRRSTRSTSRSSR